MQFFVLSLSLPLLAQLATAVPTPIVDEKAPARTLKRAAITDAASVGFASENGGTTGGMGGTTTTVSTYAQFTAAVSGDDAVVVVVSAPITKTASQVKIGSNKSIIGTDSSVIFTGFGILIKEVSNVIVRNLGIALVLAANGDAFGIQYSTNVWVDHCDLSSNRDHDKDYYDGLLDITHASDYVTVTNTYIHDHWKASLIGHSDSNGDEDTGYLHVTYANNYWQNINSRGPSIRFGTGHFFNNYYDTVSDGINTRQGAQVLVESNVWTGSKKPLYSTDSGYAVANDNDFGGESNTAEIGTLETVPYSYTTLGSGSVQAAVVGTAGQTLSF